MLGVFKLGIFLNLSDWRGKLVRSAAHSMEQKMLKYGEQNVNSNLQVAEDHHDRRQIWARKNCGGHDWKIDSLDSISESRASIDWPNVF